MSHLVSFLNYLMNWSVQRKMLIIMFLFTILGPLGLLIAIEMKGARYASGVLMGILSLTVLLLIPFSRWISRIVALKSINEMNDHCNRLKGGDYSFVEEPPAEVEGHDFINLKRNMFWMGYAIAARERKLADAKSRLAEAKQQIDESIEYASFIQTAFLPGIKGLQKSLPRSFLLWQQRDSVGGDSYWFKEWGKGFFVGVVDCTGHGVPGAFMTLIVQSLLDRSSTVQSASPAEVLGNMNRQIKEALGQHDKESGSDDGMDCALCYLDPVNKKMIFAGANNPLYIADNEGVRMIKGDRCGLGYVRSPRDFVFTDHELELHSGMRFYLTTDGITDQIGGKKGFPFGKRRLMRFFEENIDSSIAAQGESLGRALVDYQGRESRRDDVTVLGFEII
ncbi:SpoIIE family protein phosphatase [Desulfovibrio sp. JC022]|uniref:SpoIIE family protein phosphatase n=1 Tax=Desulfovibrio sp. JC022 TaxID=2593642 RepID=UPI0013D5609C|nr:SpoIIE family protein phosphatase [Desulfovibrio sp. JC022]NDV24946.1 SpoIIE family protein phosphatase [Desulfovibrio sp. JC022]